MKKLALVFLFLFTFNSFAQASNKAGLLQETKDFLGVFYKTIILIKNYHIEKKDYKTLVESSLKGMLESLDPHSDYLNKKEYALLSEDVVGKIAGIGIEVQLENGIIKVIAPIEGSPAHKAGVKAGDYIISINKVSTTGMSFEEAIQKIKGEVDTPVYLKILRPEDKTPFELTMKREMINFSMVRSKLWDNVGYLRISSFDQETSKQLKKEITKIKSNKKLQGVVVDLRDNPGGLLDQAVEVSKCFLKDGQIVTLRDRDGKTVQNFSVQNGDLLDGIPLVVLINNGSASASEVLTGALQDHKRAIVMGTKSFGKGSVQIVIPMKETGGAIKLTAYRYYTPLGRSIQAVGIIPDIVVENIKLKKDYKAEDIVIRETDLNHHLKNEMINLTSNDKQKKDKEELLVQDYQLARAIDLIKAVSISAKLDSVKKIH